MSIDLDKIELGAGELLLLHFADNNTLFWDDSIYWDSGADYWPWENEVGLAVDAEFSGKKIYKDIDVGRVAAAVKSAVIGADGLMKLKMLESDLRQLVASIGGDPDDIVTAAGVSETFTFGGTAKQVVFALRYTVPKLEDSTKNYILELYRGIPQGVSALPFSKTDERQYEVEFKLNGEKNDNWSLGIFREEL